MSFVAEEFNQHPMSKCLEVQITVIVCCYNAAGTVGDTLDTLLEQSHKELDILVIDDGSTDASVDVVHSKALRDPRVHIMSNDGNRGTAYTRMRGLTEARTDLVMFFDSDDLAEPELVSRLLGKLLEDDRTLASDAMLATSRTKEILVFSGLGRTVKRCFLISTQKTRCSLCHRLRSFTAGLHLRSVVTGRT